MGVSDSSWTEVVSPGGVGPAHFSGFSSLLPPLFFPPTSHRGSIFFPKNLRLPSHMGSSILGANRLGRNGVSPMTRVMMTSPWNVISVRPFQFPRARPASRFLCGQSLMSSPRVHQFPWVRVAGFSRSKRWLFWELTRLSQFPPPPPRHSCGSVVVPPVNSFRQAVLCPPRGPV